ncbi:hypothetical protein I350_05594 [Cryptococcus amylolentus CBS 6273]|uniref:Phytanoyl-CoA dioxygenase n=1 Tax=Cryptococcus amylolentus CBS 6273 TaxID=1296118 RepID=A0A1E3JYK8_9TREE|nr:hypothetical protein I350_05594 [Cryptococcus amylolentus CBS 6273]
MSATIAKTVSSPKVTTGAALKLRGGHDPVALQTASQELEDRGYTVVKNVLSFEKAAEYKERLLQWLEDFQLGFRRDDPETWKWDYLPESWKGGLYTKYGIGHEQFAWDLRTEQALIDVFAHIWGTDELLVSFGKSPFPIPLRNLSMEADSIPLSDGSNISLPMPASERAKVEKEYQPWPHTDQSLTRTYKHCIQGLVNLAPNGPEDGGLMVLHGSAALFNEFVKAHEHDKPEEGWSPIDIHLHTPSQLEWYLSKGCSWRKIDAGPGDVVLWDSRCLHMGVAPGVGGGLRAVSYVCYKPAKLITPEKLALKQDLAKRYAQTSHDPVEVRETTAGVGWRIRKPGERIEPLIKPILTKRARQLAGLEAY